MTIFGGAAGRAIERYVFNVTVTAGERISAEWQNGCRCRLHLLSAYRQIEFNRRVALVEVHSRPG
jgi:hypothetical protein